MPPPIQKKRGKRSRRHYQTFGCARLDPQFGVKVSPSKIEKKRKGGGRVLARVVQEIPAIKKKKRGWKGERIEANSTPAAPLPSRGPSGLKNSKCKKKKRKRGGGGGGKGGLFPNGFLGEFGGAVFANRRGGGGAQERVTITVCASLCNHAVQIKRKKGEGKAYI